MGANSFLIELIPFQKGIKTILTVVSTCCQATSAKGSTLQGKNLLPKFFPYRVDPFSEGDTNDFEGCLL